MSELKLVVVKNPEFKVLTLQVVANITRFLEYNLSYNKVVCTYPTPHLLEGAAEALKKLDALGEKVEIVGAWTKENPSVRDHPNWITDAILDHSQFQICKWGSTDLLKRVESPLELYMIPPGTQLAPANGKHEAVCPGCQTKTFAQFLPLCADCQPQWGLCATSGCVAEHKKDDMVGEADFRICMRCASNVRCLSCNLHLDVLASPDGKYRVDGERREFSWMCRKCLNAGRRFCSGHQNLCLDLSLASPAAGADQDAEGLCRDCLRALRTDKHAITMKEGKKVGLGQRNKLTEMLEKKKGLVEIKRQRKLAVTSSVTRTGEDEVEPEDQVEPENNEDDREDEDYDPEVPQ